MDSTSDVTAIIINYRTPDLTLRSIRSFRAAYSTLPLLTIDNGSGDDSAGLLAEVCSHSRGDMRFIANRSNIHHGPAMHQAMTEVTTPFVLFLDSDCEVMQNGWIEPMREALAQSSIHYCVGRKIHMNKRGFDTDDPRAIEYIRPYCMMVKRELYFGFPPFRRHGAPCLQNMIVAREKGFALIDFPVEEFVRHEGRGTARRHGYALGMSGRINHLLNRLGL